MILAPVAAACFLNIPSEGYRSTNCGVFSAITIPGEWRLDPLDLVMVGGVCLVNEHYYISDVLTYNHFDGAPPCSVATTIAIDDPPATQLTPAIVTSVPEPGSVGLVLLGLIAGVAMLVRSKGRL